MDYTIESSLISLPALGVKSILATLSIVARPKAGTEPFSTAKGGEAAAEEGIQ